MVRYLGSVVAMVAICGEAFCALDVIDVRDGKFVDSAGRQVLLHGMSVISKSPKEGYISWQEPADFARMRYWGMNCIRLGMTWDAIEPEPGRYNEEFLKKLDQRIRWAKDNGLYVFLDMHQDLFSVLYSDGAPEWATLNEGKPHLAEGGIWSDAYFSSPAIHAAFDNFWANKPAADGVGVQDHFARAWRHVAERYADEPAVIGYDLFNEPNMGSRSVEAQLAMAAKFAEATGGDIEEVAGLWLTAEGRLKVMKAIEDIPLYKSLLDAIQPIYNEFEKTQLMPMYERVTVAIREVDNKGVVFFETSMASNMGVYSAIERVPGGGSQAYAPHGYDIVVDTPYQADASPERIALIFSRHGETAKRLNMPMLIGEWGAYGGIGAEILPVARAVIEQFEKLLCSEVYWMYGRQIETCGYREILQRPIPLRVNGTLTAYSSEAKDDGVVFTAAWEDDAAVSAPSIVYLPGRLAENTAITLDPPGEGFTPEPAGGNDGSVYLTIPASGASGPRVLVVRKK